VKENDMAQYVLAYRGGSMAESEQERAAVMAAWGAWFGQLGAAVVDGGNPFGPSAAIGSDGAVSEGGPSGLTGYSILAADSLGSATTMAKGCPVLSAGGSVEVYEVFPAM
jgi:YCII-related domain